MKISLACLFVIRLASLVLLLLPGLARGQNCQEEYKAKFINLDYLLNHPFDGRIITDESYGRLLYKKQVSTTGLSVAEGRTLGSSFTVSDQAVTLNLGGVIPNTTPNIALIANGRFTPDQGFVNLFSNAGSPTNFAVGGTLLVFGNDQSKFRERTKKNLHQKMRGMRAIDKSKWANELEPNTEASLMNTYAPLMADFITKWRVFQSWLNKDTRKDEHGRTRADRFYDDEFEPPDTESADGREFYKDYLAAEYLVMPILSDEWDKWKQEKEISYINQQVGKNKIPPLAHNASTVDTLCSSPDFQHTLKDLLCDLNEATRKKRYQVYDSLQLAVKWSSRWRFWGTGSVLGGQAKQPIFNAAKVGQTYADTYYDNYWQLQATLNSVWETEVVNVSGSAGIGTNNQLQLNKADQQTYQTSSLQGTAVVVTQKVLYPTIPPHVRYLSLQSQLTVTAAKGLPGFGATAVYEALLAADTHALHNLTLGIVVPVKAGSGTLLLIPQVRARSASLPNRWSAGFTLTATIPTFLKS
ncbi:hypothetical protein [Hymenobacter cheonanensis]|uniref:hypothetical protein n=1 Tax=Hymenobacter sp. CA2-7 TaxID=3063993 RepID=UPI0027139534|nr:hypothetical protein [Hymenobacter sp. CA2-7]MDO7886654.1 hypothetical protein [Hymenobacter sp. CA2-7]